MLLNNAAGRGLETVKYQRRRLNEELAPVSKARSDDERESPVLLVYRKTVPDFKW